MEWLLPSLTLIFITLYWALQYWQDMCHIMSLVIWPNAHHESLITQLLEHPTGTWKVIGSIPVTDCQNFSFLSNSSWEHFFVKNMWNWIHEIPGLKFDIEGKYKLIWGRSVSFIFPWLVVAIAAHSSAAISLSMFVLEGWDCDKFWYVFGFCRWVFFN